MSTGPSSHASRGVEKRWGARVALRAPAELIMADGDFEAVAVRDASLSGAFVETQRLLGTMTRLWLCPVGRSGEWLDGFVVRVGNGGYGIEWIDPGLRPVSALLSLRPVAAGLVARPEAGSVSWQFMQRLQRREFD